MIEKDSLLPTTRENLMEAFCLLNCEMPVDKITVSQLARKAGYDRTTFYQYFLDLEDLQKAVEEDFTAFIKKHRANTAVSDTSFVQTMLVAYQQKPLYFNALLGKYGDGAYLYQLVDSFKFDLAELHLPDDDKRKEYLIEFHLTTTLALFRHWLQHDKNLPLEELIILIKQLYMDGINGAVN